ncbi:MAG: M3 family metallopeptidase [Ktedonobacteraceae bacterium]
MLTPCKAFHDTFERVVMPISRQLWEKKRQLLGIETLRPWDMRVNARSREPLRRVTNVPALLGQCASLFHLIDPQLGGYYETMLQQGCFDLEERANKAHAGYSQPLEAKHLPFIFGHLGSLPDVVTLLLHECGHAFHVFETASLPSIQQRHAEAVPLEFAEVASISMEFIGAMYLHQAGLCSQHEAALIRIRHLEQVLMINLPSFILGDAFQHWVYEHPEQSENPEACHQKWAELTQRYLPALDWRGLEMALGSGWQQEGNFYSDPFYCIEYAFAIVGALHIWENYLRDPQATLHQYRYALSLGATRTIPELYEAAGVRFVFDEEMLRQAIELIVRTGRELEKMV